MRDPIGTFFRIRELYSTYLDTAFRIADPTVSEERRRLLQLPGNLAQDPFVEPIPRYAGVGQALRELVEADDGLLSRLSLERRSAVGDLFASGLFHSADISPYEHQAKMMKRGLGEGTPGIVTSGTGSGKTESFLMPVIARIAEEAFGWGRPGEGFLLPWWRRSDGSPYESVKSFVKECGPTAEAPDRDPFRPLRTGERDRTAAVRCLVLYPMNALVEDQLVRLRKALNSPDALSVLDRSFNGNRIFFGRYTGESFPTGFRRHPRRAAAAGELGKRRRKLEETFEKLSEVERVQSLLRTSGRPEEDRFQFPSVDGGELLTRWDMQATPPDILITNVSMLSAILSREVDEPIIDQTREWLKRDDAYFYLVLDELHLHRGTAGTEVASLLRNLIRRLGLDGPPSQRRKLRILCSSASLPPDMEDSWRFLWDFFGSNGTWNREGSHVESHLGWRDSIVPGAPLQDARPEGVSLPISQEPFVRLIEAFGGTDSQPAAPGVLTPDLLTDAQVAALAFAASALGAEPNASLEERTTEAAKRAAFLLTEACRDESGHARARSVSHLQQALFGTAEPGWAPLRGLLLFRGIADAWSLSQTDIPRFRIHYFFKALEGLFGIPSVEGGELRWKGLNFDASTFEEDGRSHELLYCECCGELFVGGTRSISPGSISALEILPHEGALEGLPEKAATRLFEERSYHDYALFWPTPLRGQRDLPLGEHEGKAGWIPSILHPPTGRIQHYPRPAPAGHVPGYLFHRSGEDGRGRGLQVAGTHMPFACPSCGLDFSPRPKGRLSPIRHFRTGFGKTSQLLTDELFSVLRLRQGSDARLVSFSDSRQEAAKAAIDIETGHRTDLKREILVRALERKRRARRSLSQVGEERQQLILHLSEDPSDAAIPARLLELHREEISLSNPAVALREILPSPEDLSFLGARGERNSGPGAFLETFGGLGVHPFHDLGTAHVPVGDRETGRRVPWWEMFQVLQPDGPIDWNDRPIARDGQVIGLEDVNSARRTLLERTWTDLGETLFASNYYSVEEAGVGTITLESLRGGKLTEQERPEAEAFLRLLGEMRRFTGQPNQFPWEGPGRFRPVPKNKFEKFSEALWGDGWQGLAWDFVGKLGEYGHSGGILNLSRLAVRLAEPGDPMWRCRCGRVHLHRGAGICTRCRAPLPQECTGHVAELRTRNHLALKLERGSDDYKLHCEELTGQTDDGADRQRRFRGIWLSEEGQNLIRKTSDSIDLLTVTTTMEVGIDVGPLLGVVLANMPPQRFNYQQRVGRAGRRGQAFPVALTICRNKSHDLHYFHNPESITGDTPPVPFLVRDEERIRLRLINKDWLDRSFRYLRESGQYDSGQWPADSINPPDIHGEYLPTETSILQSWENRVIEALLQTEPEAQQTLAFLFEGSQPPQLPPAQTLVEKIREAVGSPNRRPSLAHTLAERGVLPMFGMPTRVRNLQHGLDSEDELRVVDRDLDMAIFEFAPGRVTIKDKEGFESIGFAPPLRPRSINGVKRLVPMGLAFPGRLSLVYCPACNAWSYGAEDTRDCESCGAALPADIKRSLEPAGFLADFQRVYDPTEFRPGTRHLASHILAENVSWTASGAGNIAFAAVPQAETIKVNRGPGGDGFSARACRISFRLHGKTIEVPQAWVDEAQLEAPPDPSGRTRITPIVSETLGESVPERFWLHARKTTDALLVAPRTQPKGLCATVIPRLGEGGPRPTAVRAAVVSATVMLVNQAAQELDIDPEEFEFFDPRMVSVGEDALQVPAIQIADKLVNGAGFSIRLAEADLRSGRSLLEEILDRVLDPQHGPRKGWEDPEHASKCRHACYRCLLRYGNQPFHGLLDWRLGLSYLEFLRNSTFRAGLDGNLQVPGLADWDQHVRQSIRNVTQALGGGGRVQERGSGLIRAIRSTRFGQEGVWKVVTHPLWSLEEPEGRLREFLDEELGPDEAYSFVDSFNLSKRPFSTLQED